MKHFSYPTLVAACAFLALASNASASTVGSCRSFAAAAADEWAEGKIVPADEFAWPDENHYILISYGKKFVVQRRKLSGPSCDYEAASIVLHQYDFGIPSTRSAMQHMMGWVLTGARRSSIALRQ